MMFAQLFLALFALALILTTALILVIFWTGAHDPRRPAPTGPNPFSRPSLEMGNRKLDLNSSLAHRP